MTCRVCKIPVLDGKLMCPACVAKLSYKALLDVQADFLPAAMRGNPLFHLARHRGKQCWHIELLGYKGQAFCGIVFESAKKRSEWERPKNGIEFIKLELKEDLCPECRAALAKKAAAVAMGAR